MTPIETQSFWNAAFARHNAYVASLERPHLHSQRYMTPKESPSATNGANQWRPATTARGADPLLPNPETIYHRPIEPLTADAASFKDPASMEAFEEREGRSAFLHEVTTELVRYGARYVRVGLEQMGYNAIECQAICKEARMALAEEHLATDIEEHRAVSIARLERIFHQSDICMDPKTALATVKHLDRVTGVIRDEGAGALGEIAELARMVCGGGQDNAPAVRKVLEGEVIDAPVPPMIEVLTDEERRELEKERSRP